MWYKFAKDPVPGFDVSGAEPEEIQEMERKNYPPGLWAYQDFNPNDPDVTEKAQEYLDDEELTRIVSRADYPNWYYILEIDDDSQTVGIEDLSILNTRASVAAMRSLKNELQKLNGYYITANLRETTSWPILLNLLRRETFIKPLTSDEHEDSPITNIHRDENDKIIGLDTSSYRHGGSRFHEFFGQISF
jgi:hypothetical protein